MSGARGSTFHRVRRPSIFRPQLFVLVSRLAIQVRTGRPIARRLALYNIPHWFCGLGRDSLHHPHDTFHAYGMTLPILQTLPAACVYRKPTQRLVLVVHASARL